MHLCPPITCLSMAKHQALNMWLHLCGPASHSQGRLSWSHASRALLCLLSVLCQADLLLLSCSCRCSALLLQLSTSPSVWLSTPLISTTSRLQWRAHSSLESAVHSRCVSGWSRSESRFKYYMLQLTMRRSLLSWTTMPLNIGVSFFSLSIDIILLQDDMTPL